MPDRDDILAALQAQLQTGVKNSAAAEVIPTGSRAFDSALGGGWRRGTLIEWLGDAGGGATLLALIAARQACQAGQKYIVVDQHRRFYPPAAAALGCDLRTIVVVCPATRQDLDWALNQTLSCPAIAAVLCWPDQLTDRAFRRWQLAAEKGRSLGLLVRCPSVIREPSWADVRLLIQAVCSAGRRRFKVDILRCRGGVSGQSVEVEISEEGLLHDANPVHSISELAGATPLQRAPPAQTPRRRRV
ncbi:ImuA family protein [Anatilimnocola sp. NA78]|uniref:ImuA family protein n=1 Tax=Anatilimnocola sp. NA78 TaxID=3415683 RepID=UPI003CE4E5AA